MSAKSFNAAWARTGVAEGGYTNDPNDSGGETNHGITVAVARAHGYTGEMRDLPLDTATAIAKQAYWDVLSLDDISDLSESIADELFDTGFLSGVSVAGMMIQTGLNLFNRSDLPQPLYPELTVDGRPGKMTVYALTQYLKARGTQGELVMMRVLNAQQGNYLMNITKARVKDEKFIFGWFLNRVVV